jgi:hypothetical protein
MRVALKAQTLIKRLIIEENGEPILTDTPDFSGLPDWVIGAYADTKFFMTSDEDFGVLWVTLPLDFGGMCVALRASPSALLIYDEQEEYIRILSEVEYVGPFSKKGDQEDA